MRTSLFVIIALAVATVAQAQSGAQEGTADGGWPPVPPLNDQSGIANYCVHRNLLFSAGDVLCLGAQGLVCVPPAAAGGRSYWSSVPVTRGDINWAPPAHCGRE